MALIPGTLPNGTKYPNDPQSLLDTFASYLTAPEAKKNRPTVSVYTPAAGSTITASPNGLDETVYLDHGSTIATMTFVFPSNANSVTGQTLRLFARSEVTTLTISSSGLTIRAAALASPNLAANGNLAWQKVAANTWIRIQ
jgi:hypothetical protein